MAASFRDLLALQGVLPLNTPATPPAADWGFRDLLALQGVIPLSAISGEAPIARALGGGGFRQVVHIPRPKVKNVHFDKNGGMIAVAIAVALALDDDIY